MPVLHTGKVDGSTGFQVARFALGLISEEEVGDESFPGDPDLPQLDTTGRQLYIIGAGGEAALAKTCARSPPDRTGSILHACSQLWRDFALHKASPQKYFRLHYLVRGNGDISLFWSFQTVLVVCEKAKTRHVVIPALCDVCALFAVAVSGTGFLIEAGECIGLNAGEACVSCPEHPVRVEVEGSTSLVLAYSARLDVVGVAWQRAAKKRAPLYEAARLQAKASWDALFARMGRKKRRQAAGTNPEPPRPPLASCGSTPAGTTLLDDTFESDAGGGEADLPQAQDSGARGDLPLGTSSLLWPWHEGGQVVHRLAVGCRAVSPAARARWGKSVRSWREPWVQILWVYDVEDASLLDVGPNAHVLVRDAGIVFPREEWAEWKARGFPIPLIKDLFQLQCLYMFGGWWADMDYFC